MLTGERIRLRPIREADLAAFTDAHVDIRNRGAYFPLGVISEPVLRQRYAANGLWEREEGTLLIWSRDEEIVGHIEFFKPVSYWDAFELSYQLYEDRHAGHGYVTEAVQLLVDYLFATKKAAPHPSRHRARQRGQPPDRREVRIRARGDGARRVFQRRA